MFSSHLLVLVLHCYLRAAAGRTVTGSAPSAQDRSALRAPSDPFSDGSDQDAVSRHMFKLYKKYNRETRLREGNTVRGFRASQDSPGQRKVYQLNLTSLQDSEVILSATFHFPLDRRPGQKAWTCKRFQGLSCRSQSNHPSPSISILLQAISSWSGIGTGPMGSFLGNLTFQPQRRGVWQMKDVTQVIKEARDRGHLLVSLELDFGQQYHRQPAEALFISSPAYLLLYANDQALAEPNSVASGLQRYDPFSEGGDTTYSPHSSPAPQGTDFSPELKGRLRRAAVQLFPPIQNNELPEVEYRPEEYSKDSLWVNVWHLALKPKSKLERKEKKTKEQEGDIETNERDLPQVLKEGERKPHVLHSEDTTAKKSGDRDRGAPDGRANERQNHEKEGKKHKGQARGTRPQSPILSFDEQTMRKARRRQWGDTQHKGCSRRNLRVDFADIGWSEWVIAPKAFDAYYCAGTCGFPMSKVTRPSNHATIQSIVRAVGIIPGVPEPCCVPEKMSPLAVLYQDEAGYPVLKVYPNMSVQNCSCR